MNLNDDSICCLDDDEYNFAPIAQAIATSITAIENSKGVTFALHGAWGAGKSSVVNMAVQILKQDNNSIVTREFKAWWYPDSPCLMRAFYENLAEIVKPLITDQTTRDKIGQWFQVSFQKLRPAARAAGSTAAAGSDTGAVVVDELMDLLASNSLETIHKRLADQLEKLDKKILILIDDMDRLEPDELISVFKLVKTVGKLPNVVYLLVFDRKQAERVVNERFESSGPQYLEKIVQVSFDMPGVDFTYLRDAVWNRLMDASEGLLDHNDIDVHNLLHDSILPLVSTPRDVNRLHLAIKTLWPAINGEVNFIDVVAMEAIRLVEPEIWDKLTSAMSVDRNFSLDSYRDEYRALLDTLISAGKSSNADTLTEILKRIFPQLNHTQYASSLYREWDIKRKICIAKHMRTYLRRSISPRDISVADEKYLWDNKDSEDIVQQVFQNASLKRDSNGKSMVPEYLNLVRKKIQSLSLGESLPLIASIFKIVESIEIEEDKGRFRTSNVDDLLHIVAAMLNSSDSLECRERYVTGLFADLNIVQKFQILNVVYDIERNGPKLRHNDEYMISNNTFHSLREKSNSNIENANWMPSEYERRNIFEIFRLYMHVNPEIETVQSLSASLLNDPLVLQSLVDSHMAHVTGQGFGEQNDRVAIAGRELATDNLHRYVNVEKLMGALRSIEPSNRSDEIRFFLDRSSTVELGD